MYSKDRIEELVREAKLAITDEKYSYHLFGSIIDCTMFTMLLNKRMAKLFRKENKYWATGQKEEALPGRQDLQRAHEHGQRDRVPQVVRPPQEHQVYCDSRTHHGAEAATWSSTPAIAWDCAADGDGAASVSRAI
jgi:hypothetical protein